MRRIRTAAGAGLTTLVAGVGTIACEAASAGGDPVLLRDSAGIELVTIQVDPADVPTLPLGTLRHVVGGSEPPDFGRIGDVRWSADGASILAVDRLGDQIFRLGTDGAVQDVFGRSGDGPGEFRNIFAMHAVTPDSVLVLDLATNRVSILAPGAGFVRAFQVPVVMTDDVYQRVYDVQRLAGGRLIGFAERTTTAAQDLPRGARMFTGEALLTAHDTGWSQVAGPVRFRGARSVGLQAGGRYMDIGVPFAGRPLHDAGGDLVVYAHGDAFELTILDADLRPVRLIRWPATIEPLQQDEVERFRSRYGELLSASMPADVVRSVLEGILAPAAVPATRPAIGDLHLDSETGRIWTGRFEPRADPRLWTVLDPDGNPRGQVVLPEGARLADVRGDRLLIVARDSLDVESVLIGVPSAPEPPTSSE